MGVVNWKNAPGYKLAKMLAGILTSYIPFPYTYNAKNTIHLMNDLMDIPHDHNIRLASLDINSTYSNIPTTRDPMMTLRKLCKENNIANESTRDIMNITQTLMEHNYFRFQDKIYI
jgi:hypothetical protein